MESNRNIDPEFLEIIRLKKLKYYEAATGGAVLGGLLGAILIAGYCLADYPVVAALCSLFDFSAMVLVAYFFSRRYGALRGRYGLSFAQGFGFIILLMFFAGLIYGTVAFFMMSQIAPDYYNAMFQKAIEQWTASETERTEMKAGVRAMMDSPVFIISVSVLSVMLYGLFIGMLTAVFTKRPPETTGSNE